MSFTSVYSKQVLGGLILENTSENTAFFLGLSNYCFACIFQYANNTRQKTKYYLVACNETQTVNLFETFTDTGSVIDKIGNIVKQKLKCEEIEYDIQFLSCSCHLTKSERQKVLRKHKSTTQKRSLSDKRKQSLHICTWYAKLESSKKKIRSEKATLNYKSMDPIKKKSLREKNTKKYKSMDPMKKNVILETKANEYKSLAAMKKKVLIETKTEKYKSMDPMKKKLILETKANKYKLMDRYKKHQLLKEKAQKYKSAGIKENKTEKNRQRVKHKYKRIDPLKKAKELEKCKKARLKG